VAAPDVAASVTGSGADIPTATDDPTTNDIVRSIELPADTTDSVGSVANPVDATATDPKTKSSNDPDASLLTLLRRLQSRRSTS
jgi:hypothetical protein